MNHTPGNLLWNTQRYKGSSDFQSESLKFLPNLTQSHSLLDMSSSAHNYTLFGYFDERRASFSLRAFPNLAIPQYEPPPIQSAYALSLTNTPGVGDATALADIVRTARAGFDEAVNLVDYFFRSEHGAAAWRIHAALEQVHPALASPFSFCLCLFIFMIFLNRLCYRVVGFVGRKLRRRTVFNV